MVISRGRRPRRPAEKTGVKSYLRAVGDASPYNSYAVPNINSLHLSIISKKINNIKCKKRILYWFFL